MHLFASLPPFSLSPFSSLPILLSTLFFIRIFIYNSSLKVFTLIKDIDYHHHCILSVTNITLPATESSRKIALLLTAGTDGSILIWSLSSIVDEWYNGLGKEETKREDPALPVSVQPLLSIDQAHQSGINDMSVILIQESPDHSSLLIGSAGDDTGLTFCLCSVSCDCHVTLSRQVNVPSSHFSAVTGKTKLFLCDFSLSPLPLIFLLFFPSPPPLPPALLQVSHFYQVIYCLLHQLIRDCHSGQSVLVVHTSPLPRLLIIFMTLLIPLVWYHIISG